jgi:zinc D-Ala-D-Ala carboxypeptidase
MQTLLRAALVLAVSLTATVVGTVTAAPAAHADSCYTWERTLYQGRSGDDVRELQIRVAGYADYASVLAVDGVYGPRTADAVRRFQAAYGLKVDGIAGPQTFGKVYELQDNDCTPSHFSYSEFEDGCGGGWTGGPLSSAATQANALRMMWKLEALRHALGDNPLIVTSGFRNRSCNASIGGVSNSQHLYGAAADVISRSSSLCEIAREARNRGISGLLGPGYPGHNDHIHLDNGLENNKDGITNNRYWSAPSCGIDSIESSQIADS